MDNIEHKLKQILNELNHYKRNKNELTTMYIQERLNKSLSTYEKELTESANFLKTKNEAPMLKRLNKEKQYVKLN